VPLIDGLGQQRWAVGELVSFTPTSVSARQPEYRPGVSAERTLALKDGTLIDTVKVAAADGQTRRLGLTLQLQGDIQLPEGFEADAAFALPQWKDARSRDMGREAKFVVLTGSEGMELTVRASAPMRVTFASVPDAPPNRRQALYFEVQGAQAEFVTMLKP
jgi:hypothetical protein